MIHGPGAPAALLAWSILVSASTSRQEEPVAALPTIEEAEAALRACRPADAERVFGAIVEARPHDERAIAGRIEAWIDSDRWTEALDEVASLGERVGTSGHLSSAAGAALYRAGRIDEAASVLDLHANAGDLTARGMSVLGAVRLAEGRGEEAVEWMRRAVAADPEDARVVLRSAEATASRVEAIERLERYLAVAESDDPDRREGARGTIAWLRALGERPVWRAVSVPERLVLPLGPVTGSSAEPAGWTVTSRLGAARRRVRLLLDTGSGGVFLAERTARRAGLVPLGEETAFGGGGSGRHRSLRGLVPALELGELAFQDALVTTQPGDLDPAGRYHGILGPGVLEGFGVTIDLADRTLTLDRGRDRPPSGVPCWVVAGQVLVRAAARGAPEGLFLLDTGATTSVVGMAYAATVPGVRWIDPVAPRGYGGAIAGARRVEGIEILWLTHGTGRGRLVATDLSIRSRLAGVEIAGYIGLDLLRDQVLAIDLDARRVELR